jgi:hypothetical protein
MQRERKEELVKIVRLGKLRELVYMLVALPSFVIAYIPLFLRILSLDLIELALSL